MKQVWQAACILAITAGIGCQKKEPGGKPMNPPTLVVHEDSAALAKKLLLPAGVIHVRWAEVPTAHGRQDAPGPTDTRLYVVAELDATAWPAWEKSLAAKQQRPYHIPASLADSLFPPDLLASSPLDSTGRAISGSLYDPSPLATSWYGGIIAAWTGKYLVMEFHSN